MERNVNHVTISHVEICVKTCEVSEKPHVIILTSEGVTFYMSNNNKSEK